MNLVIDIGNSIIKFAVFNHGQKQMVSEHADYDDIIFPELSEKYGIENVIISSVRDIPFSLVDFLKRKNIWFHVLSYQSRLPFSIEYETPETLGSDRIAASAGAFDLFPSSDIMVIDAGSAITFDLLSGRSFKGGNISPGIDMRFSALHEFTEKLPLVARSENYSFPAVNTRDALIAGVITGVTYEINEYIRTFEKKYKNLKIILTGGDSRFLIDKISYRCLHIPEIVLDGLNYILEYNA